MSTRTRLSNAVRPAGSPMARRQAAIVLETLGGLRSAPEAADAMDVPIARYYVLERRAVQAVVTAMEPRPRGRQRTLRAELEHAKAEIGRLEREVLRYQALHRAASRAIGVPPEEGSPTSGRRKKKAKTVRVRRRKSRAEKVLPKLADERADAVGPAETADSDASSPEEQGGR